MIIQQYIQEVLFGQQVCVVPRIGTFTLERIPARYHAADRTLTPPQQLVAFSPLWDEDGACLRWIAQKENLLDYAAEIRLNKGLEEILGPLAAGETVTLEGIGDLRQDAQGQISFVPSTLPGSMDTLSVQPQTAYVPKPAIAETEVHDAEYAEQASNEVVTETDNIGGDTWDTEPERRKNWGWIAIPVVIIAGLTAAGIWWYSGQQKQPVEAPVKPAVDSSLTVQAATQDSNTIKATIDTTTPPPVVTPDDTAMYRIVFRSYKKEKLTEAKEKFDLYQKTQHWDLVMYATPDSSLIKIALRSPAHDTTENLNAMKQFKSGPVYVEHR